MNATISASICRVHLRPSVSKRHRHFVRSTPPIVEASLRKERANNRRTQSYHLSRPAPLRPNTHPMPKRKAAGESAPDESPKVYSTGGYVCEWVADPAFADLEGEIWAKIPKSLVRNRKAKKVYVSNLGRYKNCFGVVSWPKPDADNYFESRQHGGNRKVLLEGERS